VVRFIVSFFGGIFSWLTIGAMMGALGLGAIFWIYSRDLPDTEALTRYAPPTISRVYSAQGQIMDEFARERRLFAPIGEIPDLVKNAFISAEDKNFYVHQGYDLRGIVAAAFEAARGGRLRGASTITQQVARNFFLSADLSAERKIKELIMATRLEGTLSKDQILELYLNEIFLGQNSFGVAAAAQTYFNKTLGQLNVQEAAYLAALPKAPSKRNPVRNLDQAIFWRNNTLREMFENGNIDEAAYIEAKEAPLLTVQNGDYQSFRAQLPQRDYFTDEIRRQLSRNFGADEFFTGGLSIRATMDPELQLEAANALRDQLESYDRDKGIWLGATATLAPEDLVSEASWRDALADTVIARDITGWLPAVVLELNERDARIGIEDTPNAEGGNWIPAADVTWAKNKLEDGSFSRKARVASDLLSVGDVVHVRALANKDGAFQRWSLRQVPEVQGGFMAMDVNTGRVLAMQGGFSYQASVFNRATQATRQPGSAFKPLVYAAALDSGFTPATIIIDAPIEIDTPQGVWRPKNASRKFYGPTPLRTGIERSRNLMTVRLAQEVGMDVVASYAERFGVYDEMGQFLANALGAEETTLLRMVSAFAMFANGGERVEPTLVDRVQDRWGTTIFRQDQRVCEDCSTVNLPDGQMPVITSNRRRVINAVTAYQLTSMLQGVVQRGTAAGRVNLPVPVAGKTGTTNDARDVWFVGFTSNIVAGCYIGFDNPRSLGRGAFGGSTCGPVFNAFMQKATEKYGGGNFEVPPGGRFIKIDRFSGARLPDDASGDYVVAEYFRDGEEPVFGLMFDGGFAMSQNLPLFLPEDSPAEGTTVETVIGNIVVVPDKSDFGTVSTGGLY